MTGSSFFPSWRELSESQTGNGGGRVGYAEQAGTRDFCISAIRWSCGALLALAVAGCSQDTARFEDRARDVEPTSHTAHYDEADFAKWRHSDRGALRHRLEARRREDTASSIASEPDATHTPLSARTEETDTSSISQLTPVGDRRKRADRRGARVVHKVSRGETLFSIARHYDISVNRLARVNRLEDPALILAGDNLLIPRHDRRDWPTRRRVQRAEPREPKLGETRRERRAPAPRARRYTDDKLYFDPLLQERERERRTARRSTEEDRTEERRPSETRSHTRRSAPRAEMRRRRSAERKRSTRAVIPPAPARRPERSAPTRVAKKEPPKSAPAEPTTSSPTPRDKPVDAARCRELMKNPPARTSDKFRRPATGLVISRFGDKENGQRNDGINISVPHREPVKAAETGVVVYAGDELTGLGKLVLIRHADGWVSAYAHNEELLVKRCDKIERGQTIARAGLTGDVTKPQIHFELRKNARPVDPERHLAGTF